LNETADSPRRRSLTLASQQKSFLCFSFARAGFFLLKRKENFFAGFCSERAGGGAGTLGRGGIPPTPPFRRALASAGEIFCGELISKIL